MGGQAQPHRHPACAARGGAMRSAIYAGTVVHARLRPKRHRLSYHVFNLLLDLDDFKSGKAVTFQLYHNTNHGVSQLFGSNVRIIEE